MASRARHLSACRAASALQTRMGVNGLQCSHEDENTRPVCMKAGDDVRLRSSGQPKPSAAVEVLEDCICRALQTHSNGLQLHGSRHDAARVEAR